MTGRIGRTGDDRLPDYPSPGSFNLADYSFTAVADGDVIAYFGGHTAGYTNWLRFRNRVMYVLDPNATFSLEPKEK